MITDEHIQQFLQQAHRVGDAALTICSSGNLSWRIGDEALVSGTGSWVPSAPEGEGVEMPCGYGRSAQRRKTLHGEWFPFGRAS